MSFVIVDVESDGPIPAEFSMVCFGAVIFDDQLDKTFYGRTRPISDRFVAEALVVSGFSRDEKRWIRAAGVAFGGTDGQPSRVARHRAHGNC